MADWFSIPDTSLDPDAPLTSNLAYAWRDNPIAIAEGAADAPRVAVKTLAGSNLASGSTDATVTLSSFDGHQGCMIRGLFSNDPANTLAGITLQVSANGTTFTSAVTIVASSSVLGGSGCFDLFIDFATGNYKVSRIVYGDRASVATGTIASIPADVTHVRIIHTSTGVLGSLSLMATANGGESAT